MKKAYNNILELKDYILPVDKKNPKVAILGAIFSGFDGVSRVIEQQARDLSNIADVSIVALESNMIPPNNVKLILIGSPKNLWFNRIYRLIWPLNLISLIKHLQILKEYDLIIAHQYPLTVLAYFLKKYYKIKYVYWYHSIPPGYTKFHEKLFMKIIEYFDEKSFLIKKADYRCSVSEFSRKLLCKKGHMDSLVVYNSINPYFKKTKNNTEIRKKFSLGKNHIILFVGRIHPNKNIETLIEIFKLVKNEISNVSLLIVGEIIFESYFKDIKEKSDDSVIFVGYVPNEKLSDYYNACDIYVSCSPSESFNLPLLEAQACGKKTLAFDVGAHKEIVPKECLIKEGNTEEFSQKIIELLGADK